MKDDHQQRDDAAQQTERVEQAEEAARVERTQRFVKVKRHSLKQIAESYAEDDRGHGRTHKQSPVPRVAPARAGHLAAEVKANRTQDQCEKHDEHGPVKAREGSAVQKRPGREDGAAAREQPHLVAVPVRGDGVDHAAAVGVVLAEEGQQRTHAHVLAVHDGKAHEQHTDEEPPDQTQNFIIDHFQNLLCPSIRPCAQRSSGRCPASSDRAWRNGS